MHGNLLFQDANCNCISQKALHSKAEMRTTL
jgi:hypothetical protein